MLSQTDVLNVALGKIGAQRVTAIDDGTTNANYCATFYPPLLDSLLRATHWNFATRRAELAQLVDAPTFEFTYAYGIPDDFLKLREYYDNLATTLFWSIDDPWWGNYAWKFRVETVGAPPADHKVLVTNATQVWIVYTARQTNPAMWDALFFQVVSTWLASDLASAISHDAKKSQMLRQEAVSLLALASSIDGQEQSVEPIESNTLTWGR